MGWKASPTSLLWITGMIRWASAEVPTMTNPQLQELLSQLTGGSETARDQLLEWGSGLLLTLAHRMFPGYERLRKLVDSGDIRQEASIRLFHALEAIRTGATAPISDIIHLRNLCRLQVL